MGTFHKQLLLVFSAVLLAFAGFLGYGHAILHARNINASNDFTNVTLHWSTETFDFVQNGIDPANGKVTVGDIWITVGSDGTPNVIHTVYKYTDNSFYQETFETPTSTTIVVTNNNAACTKTFNHQRDFVQGLLPSFRSDTSLSQANYSSKTLTPVRSFPVTLPLANQTPLRTIEMPKIVKQWSKTVLLGKFSNNLAIETDDNGRVVNESDEVKDTQDSPSSLHWQVNGALLVYQTSYVPSSVFGLQKNAPSCIPHSTSATSSNVSTATSHPAIHPLAYTRPFVYPDSSQECNSNSFTGTNSVTLNYSNCETLLDTSACGGFPMSLCWHGWVSPLTTSKNVYELTGNASGYDRCGNNSFRLDFRNSVDVYNTSIASTTVNNGGYQNCSNGHNYEVDYANYYALNSAPPPQEDWQGRTEYFTFSPICSGC